MVVRVGGGFHNFGGQVGVEVPQEEGGRGVKRNVGERIACLGAGGSAI